MDIHLIYYKLNEFIFTVEFYTFIIYWVISVTDGAPPTPKDRKKWSDGLLDGGVPCSFGGAVFTDVVGFGEQF